MEQTGGRNPEGVPAVHGPVTTGAGRAVLGAGGLDLGPLGYVEHEFFVEGTARTFTSDSPLSSDGRWQVRPWVGPDGSRDGAADYRTRIVVRRPVDVGARVPSVIVEWLNVSGGLDADPDWTFLHDEIIRAGDIWVGVSAQRDGIFPGGNPLGEMLALVRADPVRYGSLIHPGDDASFDIFTQVGALLRSDTGLLLGGATPDVIVAVGESRSAERLTTYVNAFGHGDVYDAYLLHSRHAVGAPLRAEGLRADAVVAPDPTLLRVDLRVPVMVLEAENDVAGERIGYRRARQRDSDRLVAWEIAGAAHVDAYGLGLGDRDDGSGVADAALFAAMGAPPSSVYSGVIECESPINTGPHTYVARAALAHLLRWARGGEAPSSMPPLEVDTTGRDLVRDEAGNALGGVRTPQVDVPVAALSGMGQVAGGFCELFGTTTPLARDELARRYPTRAAFDDAWLAALDRAVTSGAILDADAVRLRAVVRDAALGG